MTILRLLNPQGIAGIAVSIALAILLVLSKGETRHWKNESARFAQLYEQERAALTGTIANYRAAAAEAALADKANAGRVVAEQRSINERTMNDYETRLAAARSLAQRLRGQAASAAADPRGGAGTPVPGLSASAAGSPPAAREDGLPQSDGLTATEQAIQLDELIEWVRHQADVDPNASVESVSERR